MKPFKKTLLPFVAILTFTTLTSLAFARCCPGPCCNLPASPNYYDMYKSGVSMQTIHVVSQEAEDHYLALAKKQQNERH